jgi:uridine monophosphate synthetase
MSSLKAKPGESLSQKLDPKMWENIRVQFAEELTTFYFKAINESTGRKAFSFGDFLLADGSISPYYFDFRTMYSYPNYLMKIVDMVITCIEYNIFQHKKENFNPLSVIQRIAGIPNASLGLAALVSALLKIPSFYCDMKPLYTESKYAIQGSLKLRDNVLVLDDLITTGMRKMETIKIIEECGGIVQAVIVVIDRQEGGKEVLHEKGIKLYSLITASEFAEIAHNKGLINEAEKTTIIQHVRQRRQRKGLGT